MKVTLLLFTITTIFIKSLFGQDDGTLLKVAQNGFKARSSAGGLTNKEVAIPAFRKPFEGLQDSQKIKALALYLYDIDQSDPKWSMSASIIMGPMYALRDDPDFIGDWSPLRQMLKNEKNPRKFYLLSNLVPHTKEEKQHNFIAERTHMLFADGRVAKNEGEYTRDYANDVSKYAYTAIVGNLRVPKADFEAPAENLRHEEQVIILVNWLRENWPGCENLGDGEPLMADTISLSKQPTKEAVRPKKRLAVENHLIDPSSSTNKNTVWLVIALGAGLLVALVTRIFFHGRAQKR